MNMLDLKFSWAK